MIIVLAVGAAVVILLGVFLALQWIDERTTRLEAAVAVLKLEVRGHRHGQPRTLTPRPAPESRCETGEPVE